METNCESPRPEGQENNSAVIPYVIRKVSVGEKVNKLEEREDEIKVERMKDNEEIAFTSTSRLHQVPLIVTIIGVNVCRKVGMIASRDIEQGDTIIIEQPILLITPKMKKVN